VPVATMLAIAASFWAQHGYTAPPVSWEWNCPPQAAALIAPGNTCTGFAVFGSDHIYLNRQWWDRAKNWQRCWVVIHEVGHAAFRFPHQAGTVMAPINPTDVRSQSVPGTCKRKWTP
jgi:hypothetical protein